MINNDDTMKIPEDFPLEGNKETLKMMQPIYARLVGNERTLTCATINALTVNLKVTSKSRMHNSNFIVMGAGLGKTAYLKLIEKDNQKNVIKLPARHLEMDMYKKDKQDFLGKTWVNYDCAPTFTSLNKLQLYNLTDFYLGTLSDGSFGRGNIEIKADYNFMFAINNESFDLLFPTFKERGLLERVVPIFFYPTRSDLDRIVKVDQNEGFNLSAKLPYLDEINNNDKKIDFKIDKKLHSDIKSLSSVLVDSTRNSGTRCMQYIWQFLASNALINHRIITEEDKSFVYPDEHDINMLKWVIKVHERIPKDSFEYMIYNIFANTSMILSPNAILENNDIKNYFVTEGKDKDEALSEIKLTLASLVERGLLKKEAKSYYNPYFFGAEY